MAEAAGTAVEVPVVDVVEGTDEEAMFGEICNDVVEGLLLVVLVVEVLMELVDVAIVTEAAGSVLAVGS